MKFAFLLVTRGHPRRAGAVIECARSLSSGQHEIDFIVGCDNDDVKTNEYFHKNYSDVTVSIANRPIGVGAVWNRCAALVDADYYCPFPDDSFIGLPDWDDYIAQLGADIIAWNDLANPGQCTLPVVSRNWMSLTGELYDGRFPFWFYDTCVDELFSFVTGQPVPRQSELLLVAKKGLTQSLRDLPFWWEFYIATRKDRLEKAKEIRAKVGIELQNSAIQAALAMWNRRDIDGRAHAADIEAFMSADRNKPPSMQYLRAKANAEAYMKALQETET